ncbi:cell division protein FtsA [Ferdinandcohnia quinoae]|uniref:Pilus assembly protein PilM n=1 Tax=Fredinandcohnia quinoae TaxID=2918902 RepID=A0AAW5E5T8_9BACI|nr:cell division FtsA domain-containing protein [Fredinandcohnia sp. SECRCQ15]MCH1625341.1 pilus assembly protein PilM [Fredinandcohnia sp. SECRCQ15]
MEDKSTIFALDIGTRSVVGIILEKTDSIYSIKDVMIREHKKRAMVDGQIHDVLAVSDVIQEIKTGLEEKHGKLSKVSVAAAGRALKTERSKSSIDITGKPLIQKEDIVHLELTAVQQAQFNLAEKFQIEKSYDYYCVGYSVIHYYLDNQEIGSLIDQTGNIASVEIISTFLPKVVVESLISALQRADLEMGALTLEPIAAINVLIPQSMRRLNVALVDIGAGTSDIAITDEGTVIAYGMVPVAGDEITEAISDQLLLDFPLAEKAKRELLINELISITDILGFETELPRIEIIEQISPAIDKLAISIRDEILELNQQKPPKAVMLIGGGSLTPELPKRLASLLGLPDNRVAIRGIDAIQQVLIPEDVLKGPELVTPIGIALASDQTPVHYVSVTVNNQTIRLFDMKILTVGDCLLAAGIKMNKLYGKPGIAMIVTVNNQNITIPGEHGQPPTLIKNGIPCSLTDEIYGGDDLFVSKGEDGTQAALKIKDLIDEIPTKLIRLNGHSYYVNASILQNNVHVDGESPVQDHDNIQFHYPSTIEKALETLKQASLLKKLLPFKVQLNNKMIEVKEFSRRFYKNGKEIPLSTPFAHNDHFEIKNGEEPSVKRFAEIQKITLQQTIPVFFDQEKITLSKPLHEFVRNGSILSEDDFINEADHLQLVKKEVDPFIFQDLFRFIDIQPPSSSAGRFALLKNNEECTFHDPIAPGDHLNIIWPDNS